MDKKKLAFFIVVVLTLIACAGLGGGNTAPDNGDAPSNGAASPFLGSGSDTVPGPEVIELTNPALYTFVPNYTSDVTASYEGVKTDGSPITISLEVDNAVQSEPPVGSRMSITTAETTGHGGSTSAETGHGEPMTIEAAIIGDQTFTYTTGVGCFVTPTDPSVEAIEDMFTIDGLFVGQANRVETGVNVNGYVTDRYNLTAANINPDHEEFDPSFTLTQGSLYVTRAGGFPTKIELEGTTTVTDFQGFDPNVPAQASYTLNYVPAAGEIDIHPPKECEDQVFGSVEFPVTSDATNVSSIPGTVFYESNAPLNDILAFYRAELPPLGWTLTDESTLGALATMTFTKEGRTINVMCAQNGPVVAVSIIEQ